MSPPSMVAQEALEGIMVHVEEDGSVHAAGQSCTGERPQGAPSTTSLSQVPLNELASRACRRSACRGPLDMHAIDTSQGLALLLRGPGSNTPLQVTEWLGKAQAMVRKGRRQSWRNPETLGHRMVTNLTDALEANTKKVLEEARTETFRARLYEELVNPGTDYNKTLLEISKLGDPTDAGLLVGTLTYSGSNHVDELLMVVRDADDESIKSVVGPLGALMCMMGDRRRRRDGLIGTTAQLTRAPLDLTPSMQETINGLYQPGDPGPMGDLHDVIEASRRILSSPSQDLSSITG